MSSTKRPRVAAIGLDGSQVASIAHLCGNLRVEDSLRNYLRNYSWTETDVLVLGPSKGGAGEVDISVNLMTIGPVSLRWWDSYRGGPFGLEYHYVNANARNTERELTVPPSCPEMYKSLAVQLSRHFGRAGVPSSTLTTSREHQTPLLQTSTGRLVALRLSLPTRPNAADGEPPPIALLLPDGADLVAWFRTFLYELHESDPSRVPQAPPRLNQPSDWYTPRESTLANRISEIEVKAERLSAERDQLDAELAAETERADRGIRRALWADGDDLVNVAEEILAGLGFRVCNMDTELKPGEPKREDLRLTLPTSPGWEGIVEVKGYTDGVKTNDARQIREHRDHYIEEKSRPPDLTVWLSNPHRMMDPSVRPEPDENVRNQADTIDAVHVLASDLCRQWLLVAAGSLDSGIVVQSLVEASPGLWTPPVSPAVTAQAPAG